MNYVQVCIIHLNITYNQVYHMITTYYNTQYRSQIKELNVLELYFQFITKFPNIHF